MINIDNMEHEYLEQILNMFFIKDGGKICYYEWYLFFRYWKKPLTLHELLEEVEKVDSGSNIPEHTDITIFRQIMLMTITLMKIVARKKMLT